MPMVYGVVSDVHSNVEALTVVLDFFKDFEVDGYICCGDIVGYGPEPDEVVARLRKLKNMHCIVGNHDLAVLGLMDVEWFNPFAKAAALWSRDMLSPESKRWLQSLTAKIETPEFTVVHGTPRKPPEEYLLSAAQFKDNMPLVHAWPLFVGHSHMPLCFRVNKDEPLGIETMILEDHQQIEIQRMPYGIVPTAFNPGSAGQPRDQDKRASCGLYDSGKGTFRIIRLNYDIVAVQNKIRNAGLPEFLALRLAYGQ
ncbi:MAG: metallophosphoesterase family protein [Elusimicrobia bacterium]|nr:metallophosphoesterase family protein [Elusimicrobiota bacterium]